MARQIVVVRAGVAALLRVGSGYLDDGQPYNLLARSNPLTPEGAGGESIFVSLYLTLRAYEAAVTYAITPIVDDVRLATQTLVVPIGTATGVRRVYEIGLSIPTLRGGVEMIRTYPRGTWIAVEIASVVGVGGALARHRIESVEVETEPVEETQEAIG